MKLEFCQVCLTRITACIGELSMSLTSSALRMSVWCSMKFASTFHASHCFGLSTNAWSRLPHGFPSGSGGGAPTPETAGASASILLILSYRLVMQPVAGSTVTLRMLFSSDDAVATTLGAISTFTLAGRGLTTKVLYPIGGMAE